MATYNGEKYVAEQLSSILKELSFEDEVIIVDDCSKDRTVSVIEALGDSRIKIFHNNRNRGHVYSFERCISLTQNNIIFMSDQDDVWLDDRLEVMVDKLRETHCLLVSSNNSFMDIEGNRIDFPIDGVRSENSSKYAKNIVDIFKGKTNYYGCAMAFHRDLLALILPIPSFVESHDLWIAMAANLVKSNVHLDTNTLVRRVHNENASIVSRKISEKLWSRWIFARSMLVLMTRIRRFSTA